MSDGLNRVMLLGNLGADPELRSTTGGNSVLKLRLATAETYLDKNRQKQEKTEWHSVVIWGKRAESLAKFLSKGSRIFVEGSLRTSSYDDKDGNKRYRTEVNATNIILCGGRGCGQNQQSEPQPQTTGGGYDEAEYGATSGNDDFPF